MKKDSTPNHPLVPQEDKNVITSEKKNQYPSYSKLAIEDALQPLRESKLHLAFFCLILTVIYKFNNKTWRKSDNDNILKDGVVSRLIDSLQLWLWVDSDSNFDIKKYFIINNIPLIDFGPIECIDLSSSLEEIVMCDQETIYQIIELLKNEINFKDRMKDLKRNMNDSIKQEHNKDVIRNDDEGKLKHDTNSDIDSKVKHKVMKPTGYRVLMKALGLNNNVMENKMEVSGIDENKLMKLVSTIRPADIKRKQSIYSTTSPKGSPSYPERKTFSASKVKNVDLDDNEEIQASPMQSPKASPTFKVPKFDPNQSISTLQDDDEMMEKMTNIEKIMYKIQSQLEIVDLYTNNGRNDEEDQNFNTDFNLLSSSNNNTKPLTPKLGMRHKITLPDDTVQTTVIVNDSGSIPIKKKKQLKKQTSDTLFILCDQKFE
jgi:hypothetical protein